MHAWWRLQSLRLLLVLNQFSMGLGGGHESSEIILAVNLVSLADLEIAYEELEIVDYGPNGQAYGKMTGRFSGERLEGEVTLTNLAMLRADGVNQPTMRGILKTADGADIWVELDGLATLRESDEARTFVASVRFRTGEARYGWLNELLAVVEGVLDTNSGSARGRLHECSATIT